MYKIKSCVIYIVRYYYGFLANKRLLLASKRTVAEGSAAADACYDDYMTCLGLRKYICLILFHYHFQLVSAKVIFLMQYIQ